MLASKKMRVMRNWEKLSGKAKASSMHWFGEAKLRTIPIPKRDGVFDNPGLRAFRCLIRSSDIKLSILLNEKSNSFNLRV